MLKDPLPQSSSAEYHFQTDSGQFYSFRIFEIQMLIFPGYNHDMSTISEEMISNIKIILFSWSRFH